MGSMKKTHIVASRPTPLLFEDKPLFGLDIGHTSVRVVQIVKGLKRPRIIGYGSATFDSVAIEDGEIVRPEVIAEATLKLFKTNLVGDITTKRVAMSVPVARAFTRSIDAMKLSDKEIAEAVQTEVEQYIPAAIESLYIDYTRVVDKKGRASVSIIAMPRKIVDSYVILARMLGLEVVLIQTSSGAGANLFSHDAQSDLATVLVDFGSDSADITIYDKNPIISGTAPCGGEQITSIIGKTLGVTEKEALIIKSRYGMSVSKKQQQIENALKPTLALLTREIRRTIRYYEERSKAKRSVAQIVIMGGGANMPGLADYLTNDLRLPVRAFDPSTYVSYGRLQPVGAGERMSYVTAVGLALYDSSEVFRT